MLSSDFAGGKIVPDPILCEKITYNVASSDEVDDLYLAYAVTKPMIRRKEIKTEHF